MNGTLFKDKNDWKIEYVEEIKYDAYTTSTAVKHIKLHPDNYLDADLLFPYSIGMEIGFDIINNVAIPHRDSFYINTANIPIKTMGDRLKEHLANISSQQFKKEIEEIEKEGYTSGPTMEEFIDNRKEKLETLARLLAKSWFYMDWKWENPNERVMQMLMQELGLYPFKDEDEMIQQTQVDENLYKQASKEIKGYNKQSIDFELRIPPEPTYTNLTLDFEVRSSACETEDCPHCVYERQQEYEAELEKDACIDFAKWLAQSDWMSIWVKDKWMWECQLENSKMGYKTEEELYQIYLKEN